MSKLATLLLSVLLCASLAWTEEDRTKELERVQAAQKVLNEIMATPDNAIPEEILAAADCVAIVPSMVRAGFIVGGRYGRGIATCRTAGQGANRWSAPVPIRIEGGSFGLQIGGQAVDLVMLAMNRKGMEDLLSSKFRIGADISAAAGPVGRHAEGATDWKMRAQLLTYSRSRGAFAGVTLNGAVVRQDEDATAELYGRKISHLAILNGQVPPPPGTRPFLTEVAKYFREAKTEAAERRERPSETTTGSTSAGTGGTGATATAPAGREQQQTGSSAVAGRAQPSAQPSGTRAETTQETRPAGSEQSPEQVRTAIMDQLRNTPNIDLQNVQVQVTDDTVVLTGTAPNDKTRATIERIAREHAAGRSVQSQLNVK
ncbi:MAG: YSC84-related protein [Terriglobales bacterium]